MTRDYVERLRQEHPLRDLFWECTLRCNLSCRHCGSDCLKESAIPDMPFADFLPVLDEVAAHCDPKQVMVETVGGEPLARPDLMDCGRAIRERGFMWGLVTNGLILDRSLAREMAQAGITSLSIDVDNDTLTVYNQGKEDINLNGCRVYSTKGNELLTLPDAAVAAGGQIVIGTRTTEAGADVYLDAKRVWNKKNLERAILYDAYGRVLACTDNGFTE